MTSCWVPTKPPPEIRQFQVLSEDTFWSVWRELKHSPKLVLVMNKENTLEIWVLCKPIDYFGYTAVLL